MSDLMIQYDYYMSQAEKCEYLMDDFSENYHKMYLQLAKNLERLIEGMI